MNELLVNVIIVGIGTDTQEQLHVRTQPLWEAAPAVVETAIADMAMEMANLCGTAEFTVKIRTINP